MTEKIQEFLKNKLAFKDGSPAFYLLFAQGIEKSAFFLLFLLLAQFFLKDQYGIVVTLFAVSNLVATFFDLGFPFYLQRESAKRSAALGVHLRMALIAKVLVFPLYFLIIYFYAKSSGIALRYTMLISCSVYLFSIGSILGAVLLGRKEAKEYFIVLLGSRGMMILSLIILLFAVSKPFLFLWSLPIGGILYLVLIYQKLPQLKGDERKVYGDSITTLLRRSVPLGMGALLVFIYDRADLILIEKLAGSSAAADYAIAYSLYKFPQIFAGAVINPFYSEMSEYFHERSHFPLKEVYARIKFVLVASLIFFVFAYVLAPYFVPAMYSEKYANSALLLQVLVFGLPFLFMNNLTGVLLNAANREVAATVTVFAGALLNILLNITVIPVYGATGAAYVTIATEAMILVFQLGFIGQYALLRKGQE